MFSLGGWQVPVAVASIVWLLVELTALLLPSMFWDAVKVVGLFVVAGIVIFTGFLVFSRRSLEREPGTDVLETSTL